MAEQKTATRVISLEDIKFNEDNKAMAAVACIPLIGFILFFVEKKDLFVRYYAAQLAIAGAVPLVLYVIPFIGWFLLPFVYLGLFILTIYSGIQAYSGKRFDVPVVSGWALKVMNSIQ